MCPLDLGALEFRSRLTGEPELHGNATAIEKLPGGAERSWRISLPAGRTGQLDIVEKQGLAGILSVLAADGSELVEADLRERAPAAKNLLIPPGAAQIRMQAYDHGSLERAFEFRISESRDLSPQDVMWIRPSPQEKALAVWRQLSDTPHQATVLIHLATIRAAQRDLKPAIEDCQCCPDLATSR
jgi:hypothetical protein